MAKIINIRNVPDRLHRKLKSRAAPAGQSLSRYMLDIAICSAERPTPEELEARFSRRIPVNLKESPVDIIRRTRDAADL